MFQVCLTVSIVSSDPYSCAETNMCDASGSCSAVIAASSDIRYSGSKKLN
jgi:hypothetical protein